MMSKLLRTLLTAAVIFILSITVCVFSSAEEDEVIERDLDIRVELFGAQEAYTEIQILPGKTDLEYALFLPSDCDRNNLRVIFDYEKLLIDGKPVTSGKTTPAFAEDKTVKVETEDGEFDVKICSSANLPAVFINTESGSLNAVHADKSHKEKATLTLTDGGKTVIDSNALAYIKGRGNSSWGYNEKRSYNIKFDEKTGILGMPAAKRWALVSNNMDNTLMRNAIAYTAAQMTNLPYTVDFRFVDLYINGDYRGNYIICEKIEVDEDRININDLENDNEEANPDIDLDEAECVEKEDDGMFLKYWELPDEPDDISGGYLLEYDKEDLETKESVFISQKGFCLNIHSPKHITKKEIKYISSFYDEFEQALFSPDGKNSKGKSFMDYIDADSFTEAAAIYNFMSEHDNGWVSLYIFLPEGSDKFVMGPVWDFDVAMKSPDDLPKIVQLAAERVIETDEAISENEDLSTLQQLFSRREFADLVAERTLELCDIFTSRLNDRVKEMFETTAASAECDRLRWSYEVTDETDMQLSSFILKRAETIKKYFSDFDASVDAEVKRMKADNSYSSETSASLKDKPAVIIVASAVTAAVIIVCAAVIKKKRHGK